MTFSSPPTESAFYLLFGMQSNRTPCEFYLSPNLLYHSGSCPTGLHVLSADWAGVVSGLSGRNLGGRALPVKFEFRSHTENRLLGKAAGRKTLCHWTQPFTGWMVLFCRVRIPGNCLHQKIFPLHSLCKQLRSSFFSRGWHAQGWELMWKYPACSDGVCCSCSWSVSPLGHSWGSSSQLFSS